MYRLTDAWPQHKSTAPRKKPQDKIEPRESEHASNATQQEQSEEGPTHQRRYLGQVQVKKYVFK